MPLPVMVAARALAAGDERPKQACGLAIKNEY
jgi:hypothetical protein